MITQYLWFHSESKKGCFSIIMRKFFCHNTYGKEFKEDGQ